MPTLDLKTNHKAVKDYYAGLDVFHRPGVTPETVAHAPIQRPLGNRSALEWIIDRYQVHKDKRNGIVNDPNRADDPKYIVRLIGKVITVSLETVEIVRNLPPIP